VVRPLDQGRGEQGREGSALRNQGPALHDGQRRRQLASHHAIDPELTVEVPGFIPDDYVPDPGQRLELYKRLSAIETDDDLRDVIAEIADRYGPVPGDVVLLGELMGVKAIARNAGALALEISAARVAVALAEANPVARALLACGWRKLPDGRYAIAPPVPGGAAGAGTCRAANVPAHRHNPPTVASSVFGVM
jgi:hypothetical protein